MSKKLDEKAMMNELAGNSPYFPKNDDSNIQETKKHAEKQSTEETKKHFPTPSQETVNLNIPLNRSQATEKVRYATYLRPDTIKRIKIAALVESRKEYDIVQQILDIHFSTAQNDTD